MTPTRRPSLTARTSSSDGLANPAPEESHLRSSWEGQDPSANTLPSLAIRQIAGSRALFQPQPYEVIRHPLSFRSPDYDLIGPRPLSAVMCAVRHRDLHGDTCKALLASGTLAVCR
jgi:hypothetical protein